MDIYGYLINVDDICIIFVVDLCDMFIHAVLIFSDFVCSFSEGHANKNSGGQLTSCLRTAFYGSFFCDIGSCAAHGMPPMAFGMHSPMSDKLQALLSNPYYLVEDCDSWKFIHFVSFCIIL